MFMSPYFIFKIQAFTHLELRTNAVKHQQKLVALYLGVQCYSLHADNLNTFYLIHPSHGICDLHWLKQNGGYCWLYKMRPGNDCNFTHYKTTCYDMTWITLSLTQKNFKFWLHNLLLLDKNTMLIKIQTHYWIIRLWAVSVFSFYMFH